MDTPPTVYSSTPKLTAVPDEWRCTYCGTAGTRPVTKMVCASCGDRCYTHPGCAEAIIRNRTGTRCLQCETEGRVIPRYITYRRPGTRRPGACGALPGTVRFSTQNRVTDTETGQAGVRTETAQDATDPP